MPRANGSRIEELRLREGLTVRDLAEGSSTSIGALYRARNSEWVAKKTIDKLAIFFNVVDDELMQDVSARQQYLDLDISDNPILDVFSKEDVENKLGSTARLIPEQSPLVRFRVSEHDKIQLSPALADQNDYDTIEALRHEMLADDGPLRLLKQRFAQVNVPQADLFGPIVKKYYDELSKVPTEINYATLYARGARFYSARATSARQVQSGDWPGPEPTEAEAIDAICTHHGPLIMASAVGRQIVINAHEYETTPAIHRQEQEIIGELGQLMASEIDIIEPDSAEAIRDLTAPIQDDPQPARSRGLRLLVASSALTVFAGGTAWFVAGGTIAAVSLAVAGVGGAFLWEIAKKTDVFKGTSDDIANYIDELTRESQNKKYDKQKILLKRIADFASKQRAIFLRVAGLREEFGWAKRVFMDRSEFSSGDNMADELSCNEAESTILGEDFLERICKNINAVGDFQSRSQLAHALRASLIGKSSNGLDDVVSGHEILIKYELDAATANGFRILLNQKMRENYAIALKELQADSNIFIDRSLNQNFLEFCNVRNVVKFRGDFLFTYAEYHLLLGIGLPTKLPNRLMRILSIADSEL